MKFTGAIWALAVWFSAAAHAEPAMDSALFSLASAWDHARYAISEDRAQFAALAPLAAEAEAIAGQFPASAAPVAWRGVIAATQAGATSGLDALGHAHTAKALLETAMEMRADHATQCMLFTTLGELYAQAPGFPLAFGDRRRAEQYLMRGVACDPLGVETNLYYGDFLVSEGRYREAVVVLSRALQAPPRPGREIGDSGARAEASASRARALSHMSH